MTWARTALACALACAVSPAAARAGDASPAPAEPPASPGGLESRIARLEAELAELEAASDAALAASESAVETKDPVFRLYGFIDMGLQKLWATDDIVLPTTKTTFVLGNVNLYLDFHPAQDWSSLVEVRLTNYPAGTDQAGIPAFGQPYTRTNVTSPDPGNGEGYSTIRWGAIVLERAYIQWQRSAKLGLRVGQFLTPYGIWNVDHGTPTLIALFRPRAQLHEMFPEHQLGVEAFGRVDDVPGARWQLDWNAYVSNGRTPGVVALTENKMVGGRVVASTTRPTPMAFGLSAMRGTYVDQQRDADPITGLSTRPTVVYYNEWALGIDASIDLGPLRLRSEAALRHKNYRTGERERWYPGLYIADGYEGDVYALASYRIPGTRFEPYVYEEYYRWPTPVGDELLTSSVGLNTYFTPAIQLKIQLARASWIESIPAFGQTDADETFLAGKLVMGF